VQRAVWPIIRDGDNIQEDNIHPRENIRVAGHGCQFDGQYNLARSVRPRVGIRTQVVIQRDRRTPVNSATFKQPCLGFGFEGLDFVAVLPGSSFERPTIESFNSATSPRSRRSRVNWSGVFNRQSAKRVTAAIHTAFLRAPMSASVPLRTVSNILSTNCRSLITRWPSSSASYRCLLASVTGSRPRTTAASFRQI